MPGAFDESGADLELVGVTKRFPGWENQMLGEPKAQFDCNSISADTRRGKLRPATNGVGSIDIHDSNFG